MCTDQRPFATFITGTTALTWVAWALILGGSIALSVLAAQHNRLPGDLRLTEWLQGSPFPGLELSRAVRAVTTTQVVLATGFVVAAALWLLGRRRQAIALAVALVVLPVVQHGIKEIVDRPRPSPELVDVRSGFTSFGFPSGHVMSPTVLYGFLLWESLRPPARPVRWHRAVRAAVATWSAGVLVLAAPANVYVGVHWPSDVLGGYAWGTVLLLPAVLVAGGRLPRSGRG
jgi:membrane-associated phospholipid phosphatase